MNLLAIVPWYWRLGAIAAIAAAVYGAGWVRGLERGEDELQAFKAAAALAGERQNAEAVAKAKAWQDLAEVTDEAAQARIDSLVGELGAARRRLRDARAGGGVVPAAPADPAGGGRICFAREELDRGIDRAFDRLQARALGVAEAGQRGVDVASVCHAWATGLKGVP